jgi:hypothetical protein
VIRRRGRGWALAYASAAVVLAVAGAWVLRRVTFGDVDLVGAVVGALSLAVGVGSTVLAVRAWRWQETGTADLTERLAAAVGHAEGLARQQLLGGHDKPIDVDFEFRHAPAHNATHAMPEGRLQEVVAYYTQLHPRRMVITGAPGSGKTVLAVELILALLEARQVDDPVPIRLSAASWGITTDEMVEPQAATDMVEQWLVDHLVETHQMSPLSARALVTAQKILPVIDGLDEMDAAADPGYDSRAARAMQVLNGYQQRRAKAELVVTCRSGQYQALTAVKVWVEDAAHVEIRPVTARKARAFITDRVIDANRWTDVLEGIDRHQGGPLAVGLSTPWRLTLAVLVYEQRDRHGDFLRDPRQLTAPSLNSPDGVRDHLLALFIPAATALYSGPGTAYRPTPELVHQWLAVLAAYLDHNAATGRTLGGRPLPGTDIVLHELWPLAGTRRPRAVHLAMIAAIWLIAIPIMLTQVAIGFAPNQLLGAGIPALSIIGYTLATWATIWPEPTQANFSRLRTAKGRQELASGLASGLAAGLAAGLMFGLMFGLAFGVAAGLATGLTLGLAFGLMDSAPSRARDPRTIARDDLAAGLTFGLAFGLAAGLTLGLLPQPTFGLVGGLAAGLTFGLTGTFAGGLAGSRYVALLLCTRRRNRHWLPWRLGRFLNWCYHAGLVRIAGNGYQFRHRELQDYLAHNPHP